MATADIVLAVTLLVLGIIVIGRMNTGAARRRDAALKRWLDKKDSTRQNP